MTEVDENRPLTNITVPWSFKLYGMFTQIVASHLKVEIQDEVSASVILKQECVVCNIGPTGCRSPYQGLAY